MVDPTARRSSLVEAAEEGPAGAAEIGVASRQASSRAREERIPSRRTRRQACEKGVKQ